MSLVRRGALDPYETEQMRKRIKYLHMHCPITDEERQEVLEVCTRCSAQLYLEGGAATPGPSGATPTAPGAPIVAASPAQQPAPEPLAKKPRLTAALAGELAQLKSLLDSGALTEQEFADLKGRLLRE